MEKFGKEIKKIREDKGIFQKSLYQDLVSRQYGRKIEIGENTPNTILFFNILDRLDMSIEEFTYIFNNYSFYSKENMRYKISIAYNNKNSRSLKNIYTTNIFPPDERYMFLKCLAHILYFDLTGQHIDSNKYYNEINFVKDYLFNRNTWYISEINDYTACFHIFEDEANMYLLPKCLKQLKKYSKYKTYKLMMTNLLTNFLFDTLENKREINLSLIIKELETIYYECLYDDFLCKFQCKFALNCYEFFIKSNTKVVKELEYTISTLKFLNYTDKSDEMEDLLSNLEKIYLKK